MDAELPRKTREYLENAIPEGERNNSLFDAACQLRDAGQPIDEAAAVLYDCAVSRDGLGEREFRQTLRSAYKKEPRSPIRFRYQGRDEPGSSTKGGNGHHPAVEPPKYDLDPNAQIPEPISLNQEDQAIAFLEAVFQKGENISISKAKIDENNERFIPAGNILTREKWIEKIKDGLLDKWNSGRGLGGIFVRVNPTNGATDEDVTDFRYVLVEFDKSPLPEQWDLIVKSKIPCACVIYSGKRSIHAWVIINAKTRKEYDQRVEILFNHFNRYKIDSRNKNPSRPARLPGGMRVDVEAGQSGEQQLISLKIGLDNWDDWIKQVSVNAIEEPKVQKHFDISELIPKYPNLRKPVVYGVLRKGETLNEISSPKAGKSWLAENMALSVALGSPWLGFQTVESKVWILDNELHEESISYRLRELIKAIGKKESDFAGRIRITPLRGKLQDIFSLKPDFEEAKREGFGLIILDSLYRFYPPKFDENNNADMAKLYNTIDSYADIMGAGFVLVHHTSKGMQYGKNTIDRGAGGGAQSRACDSHMTLVPHPDEDGVFVLEASVRSWTPIAPFCLRREHPLLVPAPEIPVPDKQDKKEYQHKANFIVNKEERFQEVIEKMTGTQMSYKDAIKLIIDTFNCGRTKAVTGIWKDLEKRGRKENNADPKMYWFEP